MAPSPRPVAEKKALAVVTGIAHALVIAEENRIVHRDIKPENIMLDLRGLPKLADLGLAKHTVDTSLTIGGSFMGTPAYMSPELTGEPPFQGETPYNIMSELLTKPSPRPCALRPDVTRCADLICRKMMAKTRDLRYQSARALLQDLQLAQSHGDRALDRLDAASFDQETILAHEREQTYGIETSTEGVYAEPDEPGRTPRAALHSVSAPGKPRRLQRRRIAHRARAHRHARPRLAGTTSTHRQSRERVAKAHRPAHGCANPQPIAEKPAKEKEHTHLATTKPSSTEKHEEHKPKPDETSHVTPFPRAQPVEVAPVDLPPAPLASGTVPIALPASATNRYQWRSDRARHRFSHPRPSNRRTPKALSPRATSPSKRSIPPSSRQPGRAELLKIIGKRDETLLTPGTWVFYFYDKTAAGHARIVTVDSGKVTKLGDDLKDFASPYTEGQMAMPEDQIEKDSTDALQIVQGLITDATVTSSEFTAPRSRKTPCRCGKSPPGQERHRHRPQARRLHPPRPGRHRHLQDFEITRRLSGVSIMIIMMGN